MNLDRFRSTFKGGTRQNRFEISGQLFVNGRKKNISDLQTDGQLLVKAGQIPPSTLGIIPVPFRGRIAKMVGDRQYLEWPIVIYDTTEAIYRNFQAWSESANGHASNLQPDSWTDDAGSLTEWTVKHLSLGEGEADTPLKQVTLVNCWPVEVGSIDLTYDALDTVVEFPVTIAYDYFVVDSPNA
jgi:hypothetical protein